MPARLHISEQQSFVAGTEAAAAVAEGVGMNCGYRESVCDSLPHPQNVSSLCETLLLSRVDEGALRLNNQICE